VRALALESQIHESENYNAEMALPGRFDWAFVLTYLAPLFLIVLLHDLQSGEREAGRIGLLRVMASGKRWLWLRRIGLRVGLLFTALVLPFTAGALLSDTSWTDLFALSGLALLYLLFWAGVSWLIERRGMGSVANAAALAASWLTLTLILPTLALLAINGAFPVRQGVELTLAQREAVHSGWDKPKAATLEAFSRHYPEWRNTKPVESGFHWKWYFSFHHLGDLAVSDQVRTYREGLEARDRWTRRLGVVLPAVGVQVITHHMALTDLAAQLSYQDRIRIYHEHLRRFYYPYIFNDTRFSETDFGKAPKWKPAS
jgi:ABC-2 type transport system permease protein